MIETKIEGSYHEIRSLFGSSHSDIQLNFRGDDFCRIILPGLKVKVSSDSYKNREFISLDAAFKYIRKLHNIRLRNIKKLHNKSK